MKGKDWIQIVFPVLALLFLAQHIAISFIITNIWMVGFTNANNLIDDLYGLLTNRIASLIIYVADYYFI